MMMNRTGYSYYIEDEKIREYMTLSTEEKLSWLEDINQFNREVMTRRQKEIREMFRRGDIQF